MSNPLLLSTVVKARLNWQSQDATSSAGGVASFTFPTNYGQKIVLASLWKVDVAAAVLPVGTAQFSMRGQVLPTVGQPAQVPLPVNVLGSNVEWTPIMMEYDDTQSLIVSVSGLDSSDDYRLFLAHEWPQNC